MLRSGLATLRLKEFYVFGTVLLWPTSARRRLRVTAAIKRGSRRL